MDNLDRILSKNPSVISRVVDNEAVLILPEQGQVKVLNEVGSRIWELMDGCHTIKEISVLIGEEFDVDSVTPERDILEFTAEILNKGIVDIVSE